MEAFIEGQYIWKFRGSLKPSKQVFIVLLLYISIQGNTQAAVEEDEPYLLINSGHQIYRYSMDGQNSIQLLSSPELPIAISYDQRKQLIYWSELGTIKQANLDGSEVITLLCGVLSLVDGLAADWVTGNVYFTDVNLNIVGVINSSSSFYRVLIHSNEKADPRAIVLDPSTRMMYWTDWGSNARIERASMDGTKRKVLHNSGLKWPNALTVDYQSQTLYWADGFLKKLECSKVDGTNRITLATKGLGQPFGITLYRNVLYITDWDRNTLRSFDLVNSNFVNIVALLDSLHRPFGIEVVTSKRQRMENFVPVYHLFGIHVETSQCQKIESAEGDEAFLLLNHGLHIYRYSLDGQSSHQLVSTQGHPIALAYDLRRNVVYWSEVGTIKKATLDGTKIITLLSGEESVIDGLAADWITGNLYYTDAQQKRIGVLDYTGSFYGILNETGEESNPRAIILDPATRMMYWTDWGSEARIERASMDGTNRTVLHDTGLVWPNALTIDFHLQTLFWIDGKLGKLESSKVDGTERILLTKIGLGLPFGITLYKNLLYISDWNPPTLRIFQIDKRSSVGILAVLDQHFRPFGIEVVTLQRQLIANNSCENTRARCRELCLLSSNENGYSCMTAKSHGMLEYDTLTGATITDHIASNISWTSNQGNNIQGNLKEKNLQGDSRYKYSSQEPASQKDSKLNGCTPIKCNEDLNKVLEKVPVTIVSREEMCAHLNFKPGTCVKIKEKTSFTLSLKYMEQHPNPCWEHIVKVFCEEFYMHKVAYDFCKKYGVPDSTYSKYCAA